jgi:hypothetical protein
VARTPDLRGAEPSALPLAFYKARSRSVAVQSLLKRWLQTAYSAPRLFQRDPVNREQLEGKIQSKYGYAKDKAKQEVDDWCNRL